MSEVARKGGKMENKLFEKLACAVEEKLGKARLSEYAFKNGYKADLMCYGGIIFHNGRNVGDWKYNRHKGIVFDCNTLMELEEIEGLLQGIKK